MFTLNVRDIRLTFQQGFKLRSLGVFETAEINVYTRATSTKSGRGVGIGKHSGYPHDGRFPEDFARAPAG